MTSLQTQTMKAGGAIGVLVLGLVLSTTLKAGLEPILGAALLLVVAAPLVRALKKSA